MDMITPKDSEKKYLKNIIDTIIGSQPCESVGQPISDLSRVTKLLEEVKATVEDLHCALCDHKKDTDRKLDVLKDEIHSVKKLITCTNQVTDSLLEDVQSTANSVKQNIEKSNESLVRRLQSISDAMKQFTQKTNPQTTENTFTKQKSPDYKKADGNIRRDRTLIIGDSVIKGTNQNGLAQLICRGVPEQE